MKNKKGIQLSLNMIIVIIISLAFLGVALSLIMNWFADIEKPTIPSECEIYPPSADSPVCVKEEVDIKRGDTVNLQVAFYNDEAEAIDSSQKPKIECQSNVDGEEPDIKTTASGQELPVSDYTDYTLIVKVPTDASRGTFPCTLSLSNTQESFAINVN